MVIQCMNFVIIKNKFIIYVGQQFGYFPKTALLYPSHLCNFKILKTIAFNL